MGLPPTKYLYTSQNGLLQSQISDDLDQLRKVYSPSTRLFNFLEPFNITIHKFIRILLISLQMLIKIFFSNRIIDILYNLNKYVSAYSTKYVQKLFEVVYFYLFTALACITWRRMKSWSKFLRILLTVVYFTDRN